MVDPEVWFSENFNTSEQVVLVWTPSGNKSVAKRLQEGSSGRCSDPFTMAAQELVRRCKTNSVSFKYTQVFTLVHFDEKGCPPNELKITVKSYQLVENFKQVFRKITSRRSASVPQIEMTSLNELVGTLRSFNSGVAAMESRIDLEEKHLLQHPEDQSTTKTFSDDDVRILNVEESAANINSEASAVVFKPSKGCVNCHSSCSCSSHSSSSSHSCQGSQCSCLEGATLSGSYGDGITPSHERHHADLARQQDSKNPLSSLSTAPAANEASNEKPRIAVEHSDDFSPSSPNAGDFDQQLCNKRQHRDSTPIELSSVSFKPGCFESNCSCPHSSLSYMESTIPSGSY